MFIDPHRRWRHVKVTERRTSLDFAECMRDLVDVHYPAAELVRVVMDNLSTHAPGTLYEALEHEEARRILRRLEFHFVPKHGSWLNMAEIEIGVLRGQCLDRRIDDVAVLRPEIAAWAQQRNDAKATIEWTFTTEKAREKMGRAYPKTSTSAPNAPASEAAEPSASDPAVEEVHPSPPMTEAIAPSPAASAILASPTEALAPRTVAPILIGPTAEASALPAAAESPPATLSLTPSPSARAKRQRTSRGPRSRFKARPTIPAQRRDRKTTTVESVTTTVQSY